jgi:RimJ/RimL family protein N-acetyltransferase
MPTKVSRVASNSGSIVLTRHQGYGYATEAVRRLLHYLLIEQGKHRVRASCDDRNTRSAAVLERVGIRREGHLLESTWSKGEWTNDLLYGVLRREWPTGS